MNGAADFIHRDSNHVLEYTRQHLVEQIMALAGRASKDPVRYRRVLNSYNLSTLQTVWRDLQEVLA